VPLHDYRKKRDFKSSPEPAGDKTHRSPSGRKPRFFCVQKHLASHLHYDFRLEHNGVLLSWAVPKGPALDPAIKRLAMQVEDHPIEYGEFEGVIPTGYGAGIVMLWDRGTWTPEVEDVDEALEKGDLKLTLDGYKLKGSWVLVRTRGWGGKGGDGRSWLLIKHRDDWAGPVDIAEFAPLSVKSGGDLADILSQEDPDIWRSNRPAQGGDTGKLFQSIVKRALELRHAEPDVAPAKTKKARPAASKTAASKSAASNSAASNSAPAKAGAKRSRAAKVSRPAAGSAARTRARKTAKP
jgi:bifunctional non-homologous end joining protein LigD